MTKERIVTGIDIGSSKICTIISQVSPEKISVIGVSSTPSKGIKRGVVIDIDQAVEGISLSLEAAERMAGYAVSNAFISVDGSHINSLNSKGVVAVSASDGEIGEEDVSRATEAAQAISIPGSQEIIHVIPRDFIVDSQEGVKNPIGMSGVRLEVETNIIYGSITSMRNLSKCVAQVGVDVADLVFSGVAAASSVLSETEKELGTVLVDIGGGTTQVCIFQGGSPFYCAVLPVGGQNITNDLAIGLRTSIETAEKFKVRLSQKNTQGQESEIFLPDLGGDITESVSTKMVEEIVRARLLEIFNLIGAEIKKSGMLGKVPGGLVITGGGSETRGAVDAAKSVLKLPVRIGVPTGVTGLIDEILGPAYSCSVGLVIYGSKSVHGSFLNFFGKSGITGPITKINSWFKSFLP